MRSWRYSLTALVLLLASVPFAAADYEQAMNYFKASKYLEAASEFQALVDEAPTYDFGHFMLGFCFVKVNKLDDAEKSFLQAIEINGDKFEYHYNLANAYMKQRKYDKVVSTVTRAESLAASDQHKQAMLKLRGFARAMQKDWDGTIEDLEGIRSPDASVLVQLGKAQFKVGDNESAVATLGRAAKVDPKDPDVFQLKAEGGLNLAARASSESQKKRLYTEALADAEHFLQLEPASFDAQYLVGRAALGAGQYDRAAESFTKSLKLRPDYCNAMANQGKAFVAKKDWGNAAAALTNATSCDPKMAVAWENKGFVLQKQEKLEEAIAAYNKALALKPNSSVSTKGIEVCRQNLEVKQHNVQIANLEQQQNEEERKAQAEFDEAKRKEEEWNKKQNE